MASPLRIMVSRYSVIVAKKGKDIDDKKFRDEDKMFRLDARQGAPYVYELVSFGKNDDRKNVKLPISYTGYPLVMVQRLKKGSTSNTGQAEGPGEKYVVFHKPGSNKITIQKKKKGKDIFAVVIMDARIG